MTEKKRHAGKQGGQARAKALTKNERSAIARRAAEERWSKKKGLSAAICGGNDKPLRLGESEIACYVLEDGRRVLSQRGMQTGVGFSRSGGTGGARRLASFVASLEEKGLDTKGLAARMASPIEFLLPSGGRALGYEATLLPEFCRVVLEARREGYLLRQQAHIATQAEILLSGLAHTGIIALVDEATGFQEVRSRDALAKILEEFVDKELRKWVRTFPPDFYKELYRLRSLEYPPENGAKMPQYFGVLTNDIVYKRLAPGVWEELKRVTPRNEQGRHKHHLHRRLTEDKGHPALREHLASVTTLMKVSEDYDEFKERLDKIHPKFEKMPDVEADE